MPLVEQALQQAQLVDLVGRVDALSVGITVGLREAVAALPDAQRVLGKAGVALHRADVDRGAVATDFFSDRKFLVHRFD